MKKSFLIIFALIALLSVGLIVGCAQQDGGTTTNPNDSDTPATPPAGTTSIEVSGGNVVVSNSGSQIALNMLAVDQSDNALTNLTKGNLSAEVYSVNPGLAVSANSLKALAPVGVTWCISGIANGAYTGTSSFNVAMTLDRSGSMLAPAIATMETAATNFIDLLSGNSEAGIINFSSSITVEAPMTTDKIALTNAVTNSALSGGSTYLYDSIIEAVDLVLTGNANNSPSVVFALTDGDDYTSVATIGAAVQYANSQSPTIPIYTIGFGTNLTPGPLQYIAENTGGEYLEAPSSEALVALYNKFAVNYSQAFTLTFTICGTSTALTPGNYWLVLRVVNYGTLGNYVVIPFIVQ